MELIVGLIVIAVIVAVMWGIGTYFNLNFIETVMLLLFITLGGFVVINIAYRIGDLII